jgi:hypothetical protein
MKWTSVKDRMPERGEMVIIMAVKNGERNFVVASWTDYMDRRGIKQEAWNPSDWGNDCCSHLINDRYNKYITHWAPIEFEEEQSEI